MSLHPAKQGLIISSHTQTQAYTLTALPCHWHSHMEKGWRENEIRVEVRVTTNWGYSANGHLKIKNGSE
jgi:hypothetical protein